LRISDFCSISESVSDGDIEGVLERRLDVLVGGRSLEQCYIGD